jgi:hypothetical protein
MQDPDIPDILGLIRRTNRDYKEKTIILVEGIAQKLKTAEGGRTSVCPP